MRPYGKRHCTFVRIRFSSSGFFSVRFQGHDFAVTGYALKFT